MKRRSFLQKSGVTLGLGTLIRENTLRAESAATKQAGRARSIGVALTGLGGYAMGQLAPALQQTKHCKLTGLVTGSPEKKKKFGKQYKIDDEHIYSYESFNKIGEDESIEAVYVVLPNSMHAEYSIRTAEAGKHVICEKPMAVSVAECQKMIDAAKANGVSLNIGYRLHYDPHHDAIRKLVKEQPHGPAKFIQAEFGFIAGDPKQWRLNGELAGGGALMDVGIYCIQAARYSCGEEPLAVTAREFKTDARKFATVDETIIWEMEFPSGCVASCNTSYNFKAERLHVAYAEKNFNAELSPAYSYRGLKGRIGKEPIQFDVPSQQARHLDAIGLAIQGGKPTTTPGEEGLQDMRIIEAIYRSIKNGGSRELV